MTLKQHNMLWEKLNKRRYESRILSNELVSILNNLMIKQFFNFSILYLKKGATEILS